MPKTRNQSSNGRPGPAGPPPKPRLASSLEAGERLYRQAMSRSRSVNDERDLSDVPAPVAVAVTPTTEAVVDPEVVRPQEEDDLRREVRCLKSESSASRVRMVALESQIAALIADVEQLRSAHQALFRQDDGKQVSASVKTLREDLNHLLERYGNTPDALPGLTVDVEEVLTRVNPCLKRLEAAVHAQTAAKPVMLEEEGAPLKEAHSKKSKSRDSIDESSSTEGFSSSTDDSDDSDTSDDDDSDDGQRRSRSRKKNTVKISAKANQRSKLLHLESPVHSRDSSLAPKGSDSHEEAVYLMEYTDSSVPIVDLPHSESQDEEALMAMEGRRPMYSPYTVPPQGGFKNGIPGWVDTHTAYRSQPMLTNPLDGLICYSCYGKHYLSAECTLPAKDLSRIMTNYEALSEEERSRVPAGMYWKAKSWFSQTPMRRTDKPVAQNTEVLQPGTPVGKGAF
ncbi:unnamed protein product [Agarophyton chilense]